MVIRRLHCRRARRILLILFTPHLPSVPPMFLQVSAELQVLGCDGVLSNMREEEEGEESAEEAQGAADEEWVLAASNTVGAAGGVGLDDWKDVAETRVSISTSFPCFRRGNLRSDECSYLPCRGSYGVVLATNCGCTGL